MTKWEYCRVNTTEIEKGKVKIVANTETGKIAEGSTSGEVFNAIGRLGWEMCGQGGFQGDTIVHYFKRLIEERQMNCKLILDNNNETHEANLVLAFTGILTNEDMQQITREVRRIIGYELSKVEMRRKIQDNQYAWTNGSE